MKDWEVERIKEIISDILSLWNYDYIKVESESESSMSMSKETFLKELERRLYE